MQEHAKFCVARRLLNHMAVITPQEAMLVGDTQEYIEATNRAWDAIVGDSDDYLEPEYLYPQPIYLREYDPYDYYWCKGKIPKGSFLVHITCTGNTLIAIRGDDFLVRRFGDEPISVDCYRHIALGMMAGGSYVFANTEVRGIASVLMTCEGCETHLVARLLGTSVSMVETARDVIVNANAMRTSLLEAHNDKWQHIQRIEAAVERG